MSIKGALACLIASAGLAQAEAPLSAIDWLSRSVAAPPNLAEPGVASTAATGQITVTALGQPNPDAVGLLSPAVAGLPAQFWGPTPGSEIARLIRADRADALPAMQALLHRILLAELDPPRNDDDAGQLLLARLDRLLDMGALDQAQALLERAGPNDPELFRRWFDVSLLTGQENRACDTMRATPDIAPTFPARIFCLARGGDWNAAALTLETGTALGFIDSAMSDLLVRFLELDPEAEASLLPPPQRPSPLVFRMLEAIGEPLPTTGLPLAFAQADLRNTTGWKAQIEAAERLARSGAIEPNRLLGIYTRQRPAASGGVWDRVAALQTFDIAVLSRNSDAVASALPGVWQAMQSAGLEVAFARLYGDQLSHFDLAGPAGALAFRVGLLSDEAARIAQARTDLPPEDAFLAGLARGDIAGQPQTGPMAERIAAAFAPDAQPGPAMQTRLSEGRVGEAVLLAVNLISDGAHGDVADVTEGLVVLRRAGLEADARRAALQLLVLERHG